MNESIKSAFRDWKANRETRKAKLAKIAKPLPGSTDDDDWGEDKNAKHKYDKYRHYSFSGLPNHD